MQKKSQILLNKINIFAYMIRIAIIGGGNIAHHLIRAFLPVPQVEIVELYARKPEQLSEFNTLPIAHSLNEMKAVDVAIVAVSDDAISIVSQQLNNARLVVHTSGSADLQSLENSQRKGVFYLLQSFSKAKEVDFSDVPFCLEAPNPDDFALLKTLAECIGSKIYAINSEQRRYLHVAAVFVNNFTNHLYKIGYDICNRYAVPFEVLHPLIGETAAKIQNLAPESAQTGPAKRNDEKTIQKHLNLLTQEQQEIYQLLTDSIRNGKKL
ncbi:conserved hypothetical protein [Tenacibaculum litopenaei]|uniref:Rossmann-like and DUF2520 domain-containing protein n=1 Tax=Tenacibaculum litopenaei TaxID=396016 RepID=UPI003893750F